VANVRALGCTSSVDQQVFVWLCSNSLFFQLAKRRQGRGKVASPELSVTGPQRCDDWCYPIGTGWSAGGDTCRTVPIRDVQGGRCRPVADICLRCGSDLLIMYIILLSHCVRRELNEPQLLIMQLLPPPLCFFRTRAHHDCSAAMAGLWRLFTAVHECVTRCPPVDPC